MSNDPEFYTTSQLADLLGVSRIAIHKQIKSGKIKAKKMGRNYIIWPQDLPPILRPSLSEEDKQQIGQAVYRVISEYGQTLKLLGKE